VLHPKPQYDQERKHKKRTLVITPTNAISRGAVAHHINVPIPTSTPATVTPPLLKVATAAATRDILINTLTQLLSEATIKSESVIDTFGSCGLAGVTFSYEWASHRLTIRVGYKTPMFSDVDDQLFAALNAIVDDFSSDEEERKDCYPEKDKRLFYGDELHEVLFYDSGETVKVAPPLHHVQSFELSSLKCRALISDFYSKFCGSQNGDEDSSIIIGLSSNSECL
jgi:hypothetical protein